MSIYKDINGVTHACEVKNTETSKGPEQGIVSLCGKDLVLNTEDQTETEVNCVECQIVKHDSNVFHAEHNFMDTV